MNGLSEKNTTRPHLLLTGRPGVGKTTMIQRVLRWLTESPSPRQFFSQPLRIRGFYTQEIRRQGRRIGFEMIRIPDGRRGLLSHVHHPGPYRVGKYGVNLQDFEALVLPILEDADLDLLIIDEIGPMELLSQRFQESVARVLRRNSPSVLGTIQQKRLSILKEWKVSDRVYLLELRWGDWDRVFGIIQGWLQERLGSS